MRKTAWISACLLALGLSACSGKSLSKDECEKLIDHMVNVQAGGTASPDMLKAAKDMAKGMTDECVKEGTRSEYDCAMAANTVADMEKCGD